MYTGKMLYISHLSINDVLKIAVSSNKYNYLLIVIKGENVIKIMRYKYAEFVC